jgi:phage terminase large subunit-like protein
MRLSPPEQKLVLARLDRGELFAWLHDWRQFAHWHQRPPHAAQGGGPWRTWLILGGRGAGKTRAGAQWVRAAALGEGPYADRPARRIALVGENEHEVREVMVEGVSGLLAAHRLHERPTWIPSRRRVEWSNGAVAQAFSAEDPESLRGPQFDAAWIDELAKWRQADAAFDVLQFALRLGQQPQQVITTTPRPIALLKKLMGDPSTALTRAGTQANARHLSAAFSITCWNAMPAPASAARRSTARSSRSDPTRCGSGRRSKRAVSQRRRRCSASWLRSIRRRRAARAPMPAAWSLPGGASRAPST